MSLGRNIAYLRKQKKITQENLAEMMGVTRQTVSRWESDEVTPELNKLIELSERFACKLDELVKEDLAAMDKIYSEIQIKRVPSFRMARYVVISPNPEDDAQNVIRSWAAKSGLSTFCPDYKMIGWDFPFVSSEQQNRFGMHGYAAAALLPDGFETECEGVEYAVNPEEDYAVITITEPFIRPFERIPNAYRTVLDYLRDNSMKGMHREDALSCFEHEYVKDGVTFMDVYVQVDKV
ncbi:MAG: helix-turn-helix domain-containing protein [Clostridia bacterium]|nr:helix-turn-helix domain-containing protein [Clostridia bacterium]